MKIEFVQEPVMKITCDACGTVVRYTGSTCPGGWASPISRWFKPSVDGYPVTQEDPTWCPGCCAKFYAFMDEMTPSPGEIVEVS